MFRTLRHPWPRAWWWLALAWLLPLLVQAAPPAIELGASHAVLPLTGYAEYWIDDSARLTQNDVAARADALPWRPVLPNALYAVRGKVLWMRFAARPAPNHLPSFLLLPESGLNRAVLYYRDRQDQWVEQEAGDIRPVADWPIPSRYPTFVLAEDGRTQPITYLLRLEQGRMPLSVTPLLQSRKGFSAARDHEQLLHGAYFGLVVAIGLLALALSVAWRDRVLALFALYVGAMGLAQLAQLGLGAQYVWPAWPAFNRLSTFALAPLATAAALWLLRAVTVPRRSSRWLDVAVLGLLVALPASVLLDAVLQQPATRALMDWLMLAAVALMGVMLSAAWRRGEDWHIRLIALACVPMLALALAPLLSMAQFIPTGIVTRYATSAVMLLQMPLLLYALSLRSSHRREALVRRQAMATTDPLTGLALEHVLLLRLDATLRRAWKESHEFVLVAVRVTNLNDIVARGGQRAGEGALVLAASTLKRHARDQDAVARVGEQDFALLMEAPVDASHARAGVEQLLLSLRRQAERLPAEVRPHIEVGYAVLPKDTLDARLVLEMLLARLDTSAPAASPPPTAAARAPAVSHLAIR